MKGLSWQSLRANYSLIPLFSVVAFGMALAGGHAFRCLAFSNDVKVNRRNNENPWNSAIADDGTFNHAKYFKINDYKKIKRNEYEPQLDN